jgi:hypothetical protein
MKCSICVQRVVTMPDFYDIIDTPDAQKASAFRIHRHHGSLSRAPAELVFSGTFSKNLASKELFSWRFERPSFGDIFFFHLEHTLMDFWRDIC